MQDSLFSPRRWTAAGRAGIERLAFTGRAGVRYHFAAQAMDWAGNWTDLPPYAQASTQVSGGSIGSVDRPSPPPRGSRSGRPRIRAD